MFVLLQSIAHGKKYGLATTAGLMTGCLVHTTLLAFGVSALVKENPYLFFVIKVFGALYLFYLAFKVFKNRTTMKFDVASIPKKGISRLYRQGFIMNVLNPKVTIFFLAFFPGFLFSRELSLVLQFYILGFLFILVSFSVFGTIAMLSAVIAAAVRRRSNIGAYLEWMQIFVFIGIGVYLLLSQK